MTGVPIGCGDGTDGLTETDIAAEAGTAQNRAPRQTDNFVSPIWFLKYQDPDPLRKVVLRMCDGIRPWNAKILD